MSTEPEDKFERMPLYPPGAEDESEESVHLSLIETFGADKVHQWDEEDENWVSSEWSEEEEDSTYEQLEASLIEVFGAEKLRQWDEEDDKEPPS